ncbi:MAG: hypothetical protein WBA10_19650 [Elainellaceae cyanobacterium]
MYNTRTASENSREGVKEISNSKLMLFAFSVAFFPRLLSYFGAPSIINLAHLFIVPAAACIVLLTSKARHRQQISIAWELIFAMGIFFAVMVASALINDAGEINVCLQFLLQSEPYIFLLALMSISFSKESFIEFRRWILRFCTFNLVLALVQSILLPIGLYPRRGGTIADNTAGVFASGRGSAGNYVSCTVSVYFALYLFSLKSIPLWLRIAALLASVYQVYVSDSKQVFLAFAAGWILLVLTKAKEPGKMLSYTISIAILLILFWWALYRFEFMTPYLNWIDRPGLYGPDGEATQTKIAAFRIIPSYFESPLNHFFGLGPGHGVTRLGGWMMKKYAALLLPIGATIHPAPEEIFKVITDGWIAQESTIFFPLFTWAGIWGEVGLLGLAAYLHLASVVWRKICIDDFGKFMISSTVILGFALTQMEEPGHMLTLACLLALRWHERRLRQDDVAQT